METTRCPVLQGKQQQQQQHHHHHLLLLLLYYNFSKRENDSRTNYILPVSEEHKNTHIYTIRKRIKRKTNKKSEPQLIHESITVFIQHIYRVAKKVSCCTVSTAYFFEPPCIYIKQKKLWRYTDIMYGWKFVLELVFLPF